MDDIRITETTTPTGGWLVAELRPAHLRDLVAHIWYFEGRLELPRERVFPDGQIELIVHIGPSYRLVEAHGTAVLPSCCVAGLMQRPALIEAPATSPAILGIRLRAAGAYALLGQPLHELTDLNVDLGDLCGSDATTLHEACAAAVGARARLRAAETWLEHRLSRGCRVAPAIAAAAQTIERTHGLVSIAALRDASGTSRQRFTTTFREQIGVTPKAYARIVRFRRALSLVHARASSLSRVALDAGYYDQPHFNAEFRELAGLSPSDYRARVSSPSSVNLAEAAGSGAVSAHAN